MCIMDLLAVVVFCFRMLWLSKNDTDVFLPFVALTIWIRFQIKSEQKTVMLFFCHIGNNKSLKILLSWALLLCFYIECIYKLRFSSHCSFILTEMTVKLRDPRLAFGMFVNRFPGEGSRGSYWYPEIKRLGGCGMVFC